MTALQEFPRHWNDGKGNWDAAYIVEWEAAAGVPDAGSTAAMLGAALCAVGVALRRRAAR